MILEAATIGVHAAIVVFAFMIVTFGIWYTLMVLFRAYDWIKGKICDMASRKL